MPLRCFELTNVEQGINGSLYLASKHHISWNRTKEIISTNMYDPVDKNYILL